MSMIARLITQLKQKWGARIFFSLADQGIFSLTNFIVTFLLGRWLSENDYGVFSVVFVIFLFLSGFYNAFVFEPMLVFGPGLSDEKIITYLTHLFRIVIKSFLLIIPCCGVFYLLGLIFAIDTMLVNSMSIMIMLLPITMIFWLARQACYVRSKPNQAIAGDIIYALALFGSLLIAVIYGQLSTYYVFSAMGFASLIGAIPIIRNLRINSKSLVTHLKWFLVDIELRQQWNYSKWALANSITYGASTLAFIPLVGVILGLEQAGLFRALQNFVAPLQQINTAFITLFIPWTSQQRIEFGNNVLQKRLIEFGILFMIISAIYLLPINLFSKTLIDLYGKNFYSGFMWAIPMFSVVMLMNAIANSFGIVFRSLGEPRFILQSKVVAVIFIFTISTMLTIKFQFYGVMIGMLGAASMEIIVLIVSWKKAIAELKI